MILESCAPTVDEGRLPRQLSIHSTCLYKMTYMVLGRWFVQEELEAGVGLPASGWQEAITVTSFTYDSWTTSARSAASP